MLELRKRAETHAKLKERKLKRMDPLGLKRINEILKEIRIQHNKHIVRVKKKEFMFKVDETLEVKIVEKLKKKKPSKVKKAKLQYEEQQDPDYETISEREESAAQAALTAALAGLTARNPMANQLYNQMRIRCWVQMIPCKEVDDSALLLINQLSLA